MLSVCAQTSIKTSAYLTERKRQQESFDRAGSARLTDRPCFALLNVFPAAPAMASVLVSESKGETADVDASPAEIETHVHAPVVWPPAVREFAMTGPCGGS